MTAEKSDADIHEAHRPAAFFLEPVGNEYLVRNRTREDVTDCVQEVESEVDVNIALHHSESEERQCGKASTDDDQFTRAEMRNEQRTDPNGKECRERKTEGNLLQFPMKALLKVVVEEG